LAVAETVYYDAQRRSRTSFCGPDPEDACPEPGNARRRIRTADATTAGLSIPPVGTDFAHTFRRALTTRILMLSDVRFALRALRKKPGFTLVAVLTLALGVGANTAIFSVVNGVLLRPLPYPKPDRLVAIWQNDLAHGILKNTVSVPNFLDWKAESDVFDAMATWRNNAVTLGAGTAPVRVRTGAVSADFFEVMGVAPVVGRTFLPDEYRFGAPPAIVLGYAAWRAHFAADRSVVGRQVRVDGRPVTVVGVMPEGFAFPRRAEAWEPLAFDPAGLPGRGLVFLQVVGRLKPGVALERARAQMTAIADRLRQEYPNDNAGQGVTVLPLREDAVGDVRAALIVLSGAVGFVLLIACGNIANLLLARGVSRQREIAVRAALGAGRARLVRQLLVESLLIAAAGGAAGLLLGLWSFDALVALLPANLPRVSEIRFDGRVLAFTFTLALVSGLLFGLVPAVRASRGDLAGAFRERTAGGGGRRLRNGLVVAEMALAMTLLVGAGLLLTSFARLQSVEPGFEPRGVLVASYVLPDGRYGTAAREGAFVEGVLARLAANPAIDSAGATTTLPLQGSSLDLTFVVEGQPEPAPDDYPDADFDSVTPGYFETLHVPLRAGRTFRATDTAEAPPVVIINEALAQRYFPHENPVGRRLRVEWTNDPPFREIVGVVGDIHHAELGVAPRPAMYTPATQLSWSFGSFAVRARPGADAAAAVRQAIAAVDPELAPGNVAPLDAIVSSSIAQPRFRSLLVGGFAATALLLAIVGLAGVLSYSVSQRTTEIGVRLALGARSGQIVRLVVGEGLALAAAGTVVGAAGALALGGTLTSLLFGVSAFDGRIYLSLAVLLTAVAALACYVPARRAARVDPMAALRAE